MKKILSLAILLTLFVNISNLTSFACCPVEPPCCPEPSYCPPEPCCSSKSVKEAASELKSEYYKNLYEEQKRINNQNEWQNNFDTERNIKEFLRLMRNEDNTFTQTYGTKNATDIKTASEEVKRIVYSGDPNYIKTTIFLLKAEKATLDKIFFKSNEEYERLKIVDFELQTLEKYQKLNDEYNKKKNELNKKIREYNRKTSTYSQKISEII